MENTERSKGTITNQVISGTVGDGLAVGMGDAVGVAIVEGVGVLIGETVNPACQLPHKYNIE